MFSQCSDSHRALVDALDQGRSGRHLIQRAVRHLKVLCESSTNNVGYRLLGVPRMLLQNRPETSRQRAVKLRICPLCSVAHLFHSHFFLFETEISLGAAQISLLTRCFRWALYLRRRLLLWIKRDILSISFELASHHLVVHRRQPCQPLSIIRVAHSNGSPLSNALIWAKSVSKLSCSTLCGKTGQISLPTTVPIPIPIIKPRKVSMIVCDATGTCGLSPTKALIVENPTSIHELMPALRAVRNPNMNRMRNNTKFMTA